MLFRRLILTFLDTNDFLRHGCCRKRENGLSTDPARRDRG